MSGGGGAVCFCEHINIFSPFDGGGSGDLMVKAPRILEISRRIVPVGDEEDVIGPFWPTAGGWFPCGSGGNGEMIWWRTDGIPDEWNVVISEARGSRVDIFVTPLARTLYELISRQKKCRMFPKGFPKNLVSRPAGGI